MLKFKPGDKLFAEVTAVRIPPSHARLKMDLGNLRLLTVGVNLPHSKVPYMTQISWNPDKIGKPVPELEMDVSKNPRVEDCC